MLPTDHDTLSRRNALYVAALGGTAALLSAGTLASAEKKLKRRDAATMLSLASRLPTNDPAFNVRTLGRLQGDLSGRTIWSYSEGLVFGLVPGDGPALADYGRVLYRNAGVSVKMSRVLENGAVQDRSRSWMFYRDADSGEFLASFQNPYTGESVPVPTFRGGIGGSTMTVNGPEVSANFTMESTVFGRPLLLDWRFFGEHAWVRRHAFTRWLERSSNTHRTEMTLDCWVCRIEDVANEKLTMIPSQHSWTSQTEWQSWLKMRGKPGAMLWRQDGAKLTALEQLPKNFIDYSEKMLPGKLTEPLAWA
jgi:hypothetical protein